MNRYVPKPYDGHLLLFISSDSIYTGVNQELDRRLMWGRLADSEKYQLEGNHVSILEHPVVKGMADIFTREIERGLQEGTRFEASSTEGRLTKLASS